MKMDNCDHDVILCQLKDGGFYIVANLKESEELQNEFTGQYEQVKFNWNKGQPIITTSSGIYCICDVDLLNK